MIVGSSSLVSFCVKSYNQKQYLIEALKGAFAQTYRPLEIVISDDGSTDGSWEYIQQAAVEFQERVVKGEVPGDVTVITNRNERNLGNLRNWQKICEVAKGELFVKADGDDISLPERTATVVDAWVSAGRKPLIVYHGATKMDATGRMSGHCKKSVLDYGPVGAVSAYSRRLYDEFGTVVVEDRIAGDDSVYGGRADLLGGEKVFCEKRLVRYRIGSGVSSGVFGYRKFMSRGAKSRLAAMDQLLVDLDFLHEKMQEEKYLQIKQRLLDEQSELRARYQLWQGETFRERLAAYRELKPHIRGVGQKLVHWLLLWGCASDPLFDLLKLAKYWVDRVRT